MKYNIHYKILNAILIIPSFLVISLFFFISADFLLSNTTEVINSFPRDYIITGIELQFFSTLRENIIFILKNIFVLSLLFGGFIILIDFLEHKFKNNIEIKDSEKINNKRTYKPINNFFNGFLFGFLKLSSIIIFIFLFHFYFYNTSYIPSINSDILLTESTLYAIEKCFLLIQFLPLLFLFSGLTFGSLFVIANKTNK